MLSNPSQQPPQILFLRPRFNIVAVKDGMQVEVRAQTPSDDKTRHMASMAPGGLPNAGGTPTVAP